MRGIRRRPSGTNLRQLNVQLSDRAMAKLYNLADRDNISLGWAIEKLLGLDDYSSTTVSNPLTPTGNIGEK